MRSLRVPWCTLAMVLLLGCGDDPPPSDDHAPSVDDASVTTPEDLPVDVTITADDEDGDAITLEVEAPANGTLSVSGLTVTYTPAEDFVGTEALTITATAGELSDTAVLEIVVTPVNDPPDAVDDVRAAVEDEVQTFPVTVLLGNDRDPDGDVLVVTGVTDPTGGTVVLGDASVAFTPTADFTGDATFAYTISDGQASDTATVTLQFGGGTDAPAAVDDTATTAEDVVLAIAGATLVGNDTDAEGQTLAVTAVTAAVNGAVSLTGGDVAFTPSANFHGTASFEYTVSDGAATDTGVVTVTVTSVDDAPVAGDDTGTTPEDTTRTLAGLVLVANDTDADGDTLTVTGVGSVVNGTASVVAGDVVFTPTLDYTGPASLVYTVSDGTLTDTATVLIDVGGTNDGPVAVDDSRSTPEDVAAVITGASLLGNDLDIEDDPLTVTAVGSPVNGTVNLAGGTVTFTPSANFNGTASFQYTVSDGLATDVGQVTVTVDPVNDAPVAGDDSRSTSEDVAAVITAASLLTNDTDVEGSALTVAAVSSPVGGTVNLVGGTVTFTPTANFHGTASFVYTVSDGALTDTATVTVTVGSVNDAPVAVDDTASTGEDTPLVLTGASLIANDTDVDGDALTVTGVGSAINGTVGLAGSNVTFTPAANFHGTASFQYTVGDGNGGIDVGAATVTVGSLNDAPVAVDDSRSTTEDTAVVITGASLVANDTDIDLDALSVSSVGTTVNGSAVLSGGSVTFTPTANFNGTASFQYTVSDGQGGTDVGVVTVAVSAVNDAPIAVDDSRSTHEDTAAVITGASLVANDTDLDGGALSVTAVGSAVNGAVSLGGGNVTFTPTANFSGTASFQYTVSDGQGGTDVGVVTVAVTALNDAPVAVDDSRSTSEDAAAVITGASLVANDTDVDGGALSVTAVGSAVNGAVSLGGGNVTFTPAANFHGTASFQYTVSDGAGGTDVGVVTVTVSSVNDAPVATADSRSTNEDVALVITGASLVANDTDVDLDPLSVAMVGGAVNGAVSLGGGNVTFTPTANFSGTASFQYTVSDGAGGTDTGLVTITVAPINDAPIAIDDSASTEQNTPVAITAASLIANDTDVDGGALSVTAVGSAVNGAVVLASGTATFTPTAGFTGSGSFQYTVSDGNGGTDTGLVTINVSAAGTILALVGGNSHICAHLNGGNLKCWGLNAYGNLGLGDTNRRGDEPNEMGANLPLVQLGTGRTVVQLAAGGEHNCVLLDDNTVKCFGYNSAGQLGYGDPTSRGNGPGQMGDLLPTVDLGTGRTAVQLEGGAEHTCAVLDNGQLKCWGGNSNGQLGLGDTSNRGDNPNEMGDNLPAVDLGPGRTAVQVSAGASHTCALLDDDTVKCWGSNFRGQLGLGDTEDRGDEANEMGANLPVVDLGPGVVASELAMGEIHSCALLTNNQIKCWGFGSFGALGIGDSSDRGGGPGEMGANLPMVSLGTGRHAIAIAVGHHTCALLDNLDVKCWGLGDRGQLGQESLDWIGSGPNQMGDNLPPVDLGTGVVADAISSMLYDSCILTASDLIKCWGGNLNGQLGQGDVIFRGDEPGEMGDGLPFISIF